MRPELVRSVYLLVFCVLPSSICAAQREVWRPAPTDSGIREVQSSHVSPAVRPHCEVAADTPDTTMYKRYANVDVVFPPLPQDRAPDSPDWNVSVAICTVIKDERIADLKEWIAYHRWLGVDKIHITEDVEHVSEELLEGLQDEAASGFLELDSMGSIPNEEGRQIPGFANCFRKVRAQYTWVAFTDVDEYIMMLERGKTLKSLLAEFKDYPALRLNWNHFGSSGRETHPEEGGMLRWYFKCDPKPNPHVKVIVNSYDLLFMWRNPHDFTYRGNRLSVSEKFAPAEPHGSGCDIPDDCVSGKTQCGHMPSDTFEGSEAPKRIALFHYVTKSLEDFQNKLARGTFNEYIYKRSPKLLEKIDSKTTTLGGLCDVGIRAWPHCCSHLAYDPLLRLEDAQ